MEFGKVDRSLLNTIDFSLQEGKVYPFPTSERDENPKIHVGASVWGVKEWKGKIYPAKCSPNDYLLHYARSFNSIELNPTHYQIYPEMAIRKWKDKVENKNFAFCPKFPQSISHFSDLESEKARITTDQFLSSITHFEEKLGPCFLQLSDKFGPQKKQVLLNYLSTLPVDLKFALEVRNPSWYEKEHSSALFEKLNKIGIGTVITDVAGRRDCAHMYVTAPFVIVRFVGNDLHETDYTRIDNWVKRIANWIEQGVNEIYFYIHQPGELVTPELTQYLIEQLNPFLSTHLEYPRLIEQSGSLF